MKSFFTVFTIVLSVFLIGCKEKEQTYYKLTGPTMGTTYHITIQTDQPEAMKNSIDSILADFNYSMSAYIDSSTLTHFNEADSLFCFDPQKDPYFEPIFNKSKEIYEKTNGAFDPSIAPLVNYYGFGYKEKKKLEKLDTVEVKRLLALMVFDSMQLTKEESGKICVQKPNREVMLDFNSLSPGYAVDVIADFFNKKGLRNYMINLGGEITALGVNDKKEEWVIGINKPAEGAAESEIELPLLISNKSLATSGNYRNAYESKGQKFAHIINPYTGMSQPTDILSATVIADDCISADAYATAFMVLGLEKSLELVEQLKGIEACFIYDNEGDGVFEFKISEGFSKYYLHNEQK
ncbi:MAG TPA: FAD:protein FMN transferase [Saprospiraceae bacterium]|nr:FAD:protein FMN transferase [Saprospiraceae bacterium]